MLCSGNSILLHAVKAMVSATPGKIRAFHFCECCIIITPVIRLPGVYSMSTQ